MLGCLTSIGLLTYPDASTRTNAEQQLSQAAEGDFVCPRSLVTPRYPATTADTTLVWLSSDTCTRTRK